MAKTERNKKAATAADKAALWEEHLRRDPFPWPACLIEFIEKVANERTLLKRRLVEIDERLEDIASRLVALGNDDRRAEVHELRSERQTLLVLERRFGDALANLDAPPGPEFAKRSASAARREAILDAWEREQRTSLAHSIQRYEATGDFRQARISRMEWLLARDDIAKSVH